MPRSGHARLGRPAVVLLACLLAAFALLQLVPYGHDHSKPLTTKRVSLRPAAAQIADGAWMDCYSNDTTWPWYAGIAPASFLVVNDVKGGRELIHGGARLSDTERRTLVAGFRALYASDPPRTGGGG